MSDLAEVTPLPSHHTGRARLWLISISGRSTGSTCIAISRGGKIYRDNLRDVRVAASAMPCCSTGPAREADGAWVVSPTSSSSPQEAQAAPAHRARRLSPR